MNEADFELGEALLGKKTKLTFNSYTLWDSLNLSKTAAGQPIPNVDNIARILSGLEQYKHMVWYDSFHHKFRTAEDGKVRDWKDVDDVNLTRIMQSDVGISKVSVETVRHAIQSHAHANMQNEPLDWLNSTPAWDGIERMQHFFSDCFGAEENVYTQAVSRNFWLGLVARIVEPGVKLDTMVTLEGPQGNKKSSALNIIGGKWFTECHESVKNKDFYLIIQGHLIVELAELDSLGQAETTRVKAMLSNRMDNFRSPYGRLPEKYPRQCVFVGSTNEETYHRDIANRRHWPIKTGNIRLDLIAEHREQLFAEAYAVIQKYGIWTEKNHDGVSFWEVPLLAKDEQEKRRIAEIWEDPIKEFLQFKNEITITDILTDCLKIEIGKQDRHHQGRVAHCLRVAGWDRNRVSRFGKLIWVWVPK